MCPTVTIYMSCIRYFSYNSWRWTSLYRQVYDTNKKTSYWYQYPDEAIPVMVKLQQVVMPYIEFIQCNNTKNKLPSRFKGYNDMNISLLSEHDHQIILDKIEARDNLNHDEYVED